MCWLLRRCGGFPLTMVMANLAMLVVKAAMLVRKMVMVMVMAMAMAMVSRSLGRRHLS